MSAPTVGRIEVLIGPNGDALGLYPIGGTGNDDLMDWHAEAFRSADGARRLAACWNACEGVSTEDIENCAKAIREPMPAIGQRYAGLEAEIDQLRAERSGLHEQTRREMAAHKSVSETAASLRAELAAARALLDEVLDAHDSDELEYVEVDGTTEPTVRFAGIVQRVRALVKGGGQLTTPDAAVLDAAWKATRLATSLGQVLTITQRPRLPLAMGNYETVVEVRAARGAA